MYDKRLDRQICSLNIEYKKIKYGINYERLKFVAVIIKDIFTLNFKDAYGRICLWFYEKFVFTTNNNLKNKSVDNNNNISDKKIAVYSCIVGKYDDVIEPIIVEDNVDYYMFTDLDVPKDSAWKKVDVTQMDEYNSFSAMDLNRKIKMLPFEYLQDYDYTIYVDGNMQIVSYLTPYIKCMKSRALGLHSHRRRDCVYDEIKAICLLNKANKKKLKKQKMDYSKKGFPKKYGLFENGIIVCDNSDIETRNLLNDWWKEYKKYGTRDQICLPFVMWSDNYDLNKILVLGDNINANKRFNIVSFH